MAISAFDTTATITDPGFFARMYTRGFRLYILHSTDWGAATPWYRTEAQLSLALDAGLKIAAYTRDPRHWRNGIEACGIHYTQLQFFALDIETDPGIPVTRAMVDGVASLGVRPVIYSGSGMYPGIMGDSTEFADVPLWDTDTSAPHPLELVDAFRADLQHPTPVAYNGWNTPANPRIGVQQAFEVVIDGIPVDLNAFDLDLLEVLDRKSRGAGVVAPA